MSKVVFVSYYTKDPDYEPAAKDLVASMDRMKHPVHGKMLHDVREVKSDGWRGNVIKKPSFIRQMMDEHPEAEVVCWIDADAVFWKFPVKIYESTKDLTVFFLQWKNSGKEELLSGVMGVRNTDKMKAVLDKWIEAMKSVPSNYTKPEQQMLQDMLPGLGISVHRLPSEYCRMTRETVWSRKNPRTIPVIQQRQWSRDFRPRISSMHRRHKSVKAKLESLVKRRKDVPKQQVKPSPKLEPKPIEPSPVAKPVEAKPVEKAPTIIQQPKSNATDKVGQRRREIYARRSQRRQIEQVRRIKAIERKKKTIARKNGSVYPEPRRKPQGPYGPAGGISGANTPTIIARAKAAIKTIPHAMELDKELPEGSTVVLVGNAHSLTKMDLAPLKNVTTIACNRILKKNPLGFLPNYIVIGDREAYCQERDSGRLAQASKDGVKLLLADSLFDPRDVLRSQANSQQEAMMRLAQPPPAFKAYRFVIGPKNKNWNYNGVVGGRVALPINFDSFRKPLVSCQNVAGSMFQSACILGAARIGVVGIEWRWPKDGPSHHYGSGRGVGAYPQTGALNKIIASFKQIKMWLHQAEIPVMNLSPSKSTPFAQLFGMYDYGKFVEEFCNEKPVSAGDGASVGNEGAE